MSSMPSGHIPVVDVDQVFPAMPDTGSQIRSATTLDQSPTVLAAIRNVLGIRTRTEDPKAFTDALAAVFRLERVEGHIEAHYVPRGYALQADLGAVTGGQASLYRRALISRTEALRILDGLVPLRTDGDLQDMDAYRSIVRNALQSLVDEMGAPGGPRVGMIDSYFTGLTGGQPVTDPDTVGGQLGALRERFGLIDANVNTIEEEGVRTAYWTLADMVDNLRQAWQAERVRFSGASGQGFLGTELILLSQLMEAAADQVFELESVLDSVLIPATERRTITLDDTSNLTLDGLLTWLSTFLSDEGRRLAQDAGRDGIVAGLAPTAAELYKTFREVLADPCRADEDKRDLKDDCCPVRYLPTSCCSRWPAGMQAARVRVAVASLCRLLRELARRALRIGRWPGVVLIDVSVSLLDRNVEKHGVPVVNVEFRGLNLRNTYMPAFVPPARRWEADDCRLEDIDPRGLIVPLPGSVTTDDESVSGLFRVDEVGGIFGEADIWIGDEGVILPASDVPIAVVDTELNQVVHAPVPATWPRLYAASTSRRTDSVAAWHTSGSAIRVVAPKPPPPVPPRRRTSQPQLSHQWTAQQRFFAGPPTSGGRVMQALGGVHDEFEGLADWLTARQEDAKRMETKLDADLVEARKRKTDLHTEVADLRRKLAAAAANRKAGINAKIDEATVEEQEVDKEITSLEDSRKQVLAEKRAVTATLRKVDVARTERDQFADNVSKNLGTVLDEHASQSEEGN